MDLNVLPGPPGRCPLCGLDPATVRPPDASAAIRSYPRRFRRLLERLDDDEGAGIVTRRPGPGQWSALEHAVHVADVIDAVGQAVQDVRVHDDPPVSVAAGSPRPEPVDVVLGRIRTGCGRLATVLDDLEGKEWLRSGRMPTGEQVSALDLVRHAVHVGAHHRRVTERVLARVLLAPDPAIDGETE